MAVAGKCQETELLVITYKPPVLKQSRWLNCLARAGLNIVIAGAKNVELTDAGVRVIEGYRVTRVSDRALKVADLLMHPKLLYNRNYRPAKNPIFEKIVGQYPETWSSWHPHLRSVCKKSFLEKMLIEYEEECDQVVERPASAVITSNSIESLDSLTRKLGRGQAVLLKPSVGTHCKGIEILGHENLNRIEERLRENPKKEFVVQELINNAPLIDGHRFDLRLYALMVWDGDQVAFKLYRQGVCRFAAKKFDPKNPLDPVSIFSGFTYRKNEGLPVFNGTIEEALRDLERQGLDVKDFWPQAEKICQDLLKAISNSAKSNDVILKRTYFLTGLDVILETCDNKVVLNLIELNDLPQLLGWGPDVDIDLVPLLYRWGCDLRALTKSQRWVAACPHFARRTSSILDSRW